MSYSALVCKLKLTDHPNADRLKIGTTPQGYQVVVGIETQADELGLFFAGDGQLSEEFASANDLVARTDPQTGERAGGFFGRNRRVREQNFRGIKSEGFWCPLSYLCYLNLGEYLYINDSNTGVQSLKEGDLVTTINGRPICNKYYTPQTLKAMSSGQQQRKANPRFAKHQDTEQLRHFIKQIPEGSVIYLSEKLHGTSGRTGYVESEQQSVGLRRLFRAIFRSKERSFATQYETLTGTRNTVLRDQNSSGYHGSDGFRHLLASYFAHLLNPGETVYYEIVGYANDTPIMHSHDVTKLKDKQLLKQYGSQMVYSYGCDAVTPNEIYVYRITVASGDDFVELSWPQLCARAKQLGLHTVPSFGHFVYWQSKNIQEYVDLWINGPSSLDDRHIREGVVLRVEQPDGKTNFYKEKSYDFKVLEGIAKESDDLVDLEEIS